MPLTAGVFATDGIHYSFLETTKYQSWKVNKETISRNQIQFKYCANLFDLENDPCPQPYLHSCDYFFDSSVPIENARLVSSIEMLRFLRQGIDCKQSDLIVVKPTLKEGEITLTGLDFCLDIDTTMKIDEGVRKEYAIVHQLEEQVSKTEIKLTLFSVTGVNLGDYQAYLAYLDHLAAHLPPSLSIN